MTDEVQRSAESGGACDRYCTTEWHRDGCAAGRVRAAPVAENVDTPIFTALAVERDLDCRWVVGPIPKDDNHTCRCDRLDGHALPHECPCGAWFEGCGRDLRKEAR